MLENNRFRSVFSDYKFRNQQSTTINLNISDCSSSSNDDEQENSPIPICLEIDNDSEDEIQNSQLLSGNKFSAFHQTPQAKRFKSQSTESLNRKSLFNLSTSRRSLSKNKQKQQHRQISSCKITAAAIVTPLSPSKRDNNSQASTKALSQRSELDKKLQSSEILQLNSEENTALLTTHIEWSDSEIECTPVPSIAIETLTPSSPSQSNEPTELDLFIALIERECNPSRPQQSRSKNKNAFARCRKGGYLHLLKRTLETSKADRKFLQHDKRFGLQKGVYLRVLKVEDSFGAHMAFVQQEDCHNLVYHVLLDADLACSVRVGSKLEAFYDQNIEPYRVDKKDDDVAVYMQPNKIIILPELEKN